LRGSFVVNVNGLSHDGSCKRENQTQADEGVKTRHRQAEANLGQSTVGGGLDICGDHDISPPQFVPPEETTLKDGNRSRPAGVCRGTAELTLFLFYRFASAAPKDLYGAHCKYRWQLPTLYLSVATIALPGLRCDRAAKMVDEFAQKVKIVFRENTERPPI